MDFTCGKIRARDHTGQKTYSMKYKSYFTLSDASRVFSPKLSFFDRNDYIANRYKDSEDKDDVETFDFEGSYLFKWHMFSLLGAPM
jgi:hypothetical protein